jgi:ACT domain-containing protein
MKKEREGLLLMQLKKTPIVQVACEKTGISRATYYRWRKEDPEFADKADIAIDEGLNLINDMAESQLISAIKDRNLTGIIFWLKNHHKNYSPKLEVTTKNGDIPITDEQREIIKQSLDMAFGLNSEEEKDGK